MLKLDAYEDEEKWINYDEEQTEISVEAGEMVFD